jgi:hypothetical protein
MLVVNVGCSSQRTQLGDEGLGLVCWFSTIAKNPKTSLRSSKLSGTSAIDGIGRLAAVLHCPTAAQAAPVSSRRAGWLLFSKSAAN